jgi:hypothetical protein
VLLHSLFITAAARILCHGESLLVFVALAVGWIPTEYYGVGTELPCVVSIPPLLISSSCEQMAWTGLVWDSGAGHVTQNLRPGFDRPAEPAKPSAFASCQGV